MLVSVCSHALHSPQTPSVTSDGDGRADTLGRDPQCGDLYVFRGRRGDQIKILFYDQRGYCMLVKRLDEGTFPIADAVDGNAVEITLRDLASLMANAELVSSVRGTA